MPSTTLILLLALLGLTSCSVLSQVPLEPIGSGHWAELPSESTASLRGLCVVDDQVIWASGSGGTVLKSLDGGAN